MKLTKISNYPGNSRRTPTPIPTPATPSTPETPAAESTPPPFTRSWEG